MSPSIKRDLIANYAGQGWSALMGVAFLPLYIRYLGIEAYGLIGLFAVLQTWMTLLDFGLAPALNREMARMRAGVVTAGAARDLLHGAELLVGGAATLAAAVVWLASDWLASHWLNTHHLASSMVATAVSVMGWVASSRILEGVYRAAAIGQDRQVLVNVVTAVLATVRAVGAILVLEYMAPTVLAFFWWQLVISIISCATLSMAVYHAIPATPRHRFTPRALTSHRSFATGLAAITVLSVLLTQVDKVLLSRLLSLRDYGYYAFAAAVASSLYLVVAPVTQAYFPRFAGALAANDTVGLARAYHRGAQLISVILAPTALILAANAEQVLLLWTRDATLADASAPLLAALCVGTLLNGLMWIPYQMQLAHGHTETALRVNVAAALLVVPAILWVAPLYGALGAAWIWCTLNAAYLLVGVNLMYRKMLPAERRHWYINDVGLPLLASAVAVLVCVAAMPRALTDWSLVAWLAGSLLVAVAAAAASASDLRTPLARALDQPVRPWVASISKRRER